jgi:nitrogen fixation NifU-like protein
MYSTTLMDHFGNPRNAGVLKEYSVRGVSGDPNAGPFMVFYLDIRKRKIRDVSFQTYGCAAAIAAGSYLTELVKGKSLEEAAAIDAQTIKAGLGGLPLGKEHCASTAVSALRDALDKAKDGVTS